MFGRSPLTKYDGGDYSLNINKLTEEVRRLGKWRAAAPLRVESNSSGFVLSADDIQAGKVKFNFCTLTEQVNQYGKGDGQLWKIDNPPDGNWGTSNDTKDKITCYAPPLLANGQYYAAGSVVLVAWFAVFQRWVIWSSSCGGCS